jgi:predicted acyltransferase
MILGLLCGQVLRDETFSPGEKLRRFVIGGATCLLLGVLLGATVCPVIKRLWTPSWVLYSGAYTVWLLAFFYWVVDVRGWKAWTFPFVIVGMNPLAMYLMGQTLRGWVSSQLHIHLPDFLFTKPWDHVVDAALAGFVLWLVCLWLYRRKVFIRL